MVDFGFATAAAAIVASVLFFLVFLALAAGRCYRGARAAVVHDRFANTRLEAVGRLQRGSRRIRARKGISGALIREGAGGRGARTDPRHRLHLLHKELRVWIHVHRSARRGHLTIRIGHLGVINHPRERIVQRSQLRNIVGRTQLVKVAVTGTAGRIGVSHYPVRVWILRK